MWDLIPYVSDRKIHRQKESVDRLHKERGRERRRMILELSFSTWGVESDRLPVREGVVIHMLLFTKARGERGREIWRERERKRERERERERESE